MPDPVGWPTSAEDTYTDDSVRALRSAGTGVPERGLALRDDGIGFDSEGEERAGFGGRREGLPDWLDMHASMGDARAQRCITIHRCPPIHRCTIST